MKTYNVAPFIILIVLCVACAGQQVNPSPQPTRSVADTPPTKSEITITPTSPATAGITNNPKSQATEPVPSATVIIEEPEFVLLPTLSSDPDAWKSLPIIPQISSRVIEIYKKGLSLGNNPQRFSKIGDCGSTPTWFLGDFDRGERFYDLGEYTELEDVILYYAGSFDRTSLAAKSGFNASSVLTPLWADRTQCLSNETPLACEYRVHKPILAFITLGANDVYHTESFEPQMRKIIEFSIENGVIPVLSTKADNIEKHHLINATLGKLAMEYQIPLWNFWLAVQPLPDQGLQEDGSHITWGSNKYSDPNVMQKGWPIRNLTALQVLDTMMQNTKSITQP